MKKILCMLLSVLMLLSLCACSGSGNGKSDNKALQAGFARIDCTPDDPLVHIAGGTAADDPATDGLLDNLAVTCVSLKKGEDTYLIYTVDIVDVTEYYKVVQQAISKATAVPEDKIIINATHTHSAPTLKSGDINLPGSANYLGKFTTTCTDAGVQAIADLSPVSELSYGSIMTENMVRVRHYLMNDGTTHGNGHGSAASGYKEHLYPSDEECQVIRLTRPDEGKKDIVLFNLGAHATIVSGTNTSALSADFPFPARQYVEEQGDFLCAYFIAAAGDQVPSSKIPTEVKYKNHYDYGAALGEYVVQCLNSNMTVSQTSDVAFYGETYVAKHNKDGTDDPARLQKAQEISALKSQNGGKVTDAVKAKITEYGFNSIYEVTSLISRAKSAEEGSFPTYTMLLGDIGLVFFPGEMFGSQGRQLKDNSPVFTFVITCSEDDQGYYPNAKAKEENFYEYQITKYAMGTGEAVAERYCQILTALKEGKTPEPLTAG